MPSAPQREERKWEAEGRRLRAVEEMSLLGGGGREAGVGKKRRDEEEGRSGPAVRVRDIKETRRNEIQPRFSILLFLALQAVLPDARHPHFISLSPVIHSFIIC